MENEKSSSIFFYIVAVLIHVFLICVTASAYLTDNGLGPFFTILTIIVFTVFLCVEIDCRKEKKRKEQKALALAEKRDNYLKEKNSFVETFGTPDKTISVVPFEFYHDILCYADKCEVFLFGRRYKFSEFLSCDCIDTPITIKGEVKATTSSDTGSMIGRAVVGGVIAGEAGAVLGGSTGSKTTKIVQGNDRMVHDYTVVLNIDSIANPVIHIHTGKDVELTNEVLGLFKVILSRK